MNLDPMGGDSGLRRTRIRALVFFFIAIGAGGIAMVMASRMMARERASLARTKVVVADKAIPAGETLTAEMLRVQNWPADVVPDGHFNETDGVVGRAVRVPVAKHQPILASLLAKEGSGRGTSVLVDQGLRAMAVRVPEVVSQSRLVRAGDLVDVLATFERGSREPINRIVLQRVRVLKVGAGDEQDGDQGGLLGGGQSQGDPSSVITLVVNPIEAERLALATQQGRVQLALRSPLDDETPETPGVTPSAMLGTAAPETASPVVVEKPRRKRGGGGGTGVEIITGRRAADEPWRRR